jgi:pyridoxal phosphate enzyme (YggS family)
MNTDLSIDANLNAIRSRVEAAARQAGRDPHAVTLVAVSKTHPVSAVKAALDAGQMVFGENRVQEADKKFAGLRAVYPALRLHMIGPLQTNKVKDAVRLFDAIHSVDRPRLAAALADEMRRQDKRLACFIEVNIGHEPQKAGIAPHDLDSFLVNCKEQYGLPVSGLMCIPPAGADAAPYFRELAALAKKCRVSCLSMGMSGDFEAAIAAGATHVRVGSSIFGVRT